MNILGRIGGAASVLALVATASGCVRYFPYEYLALDENVVEVTARGTQLDGGSPLRKHEEMPLSYRLIRPEYEIAAHVYRENVWKTMLVFELRGTAETDDIFLVGIDRANCFGAFHADHPVLTLPPEPYSTSLRYSWFRHNDKRCAAAPELTADERIILLRVEDEHGEVIGEERLPFEVRQNGYIRQVTSL